MSDLEQRLRVALQHRADQIHPHAYAEAEFASRLAGRRTRRLRWQPWLLAVAAAVVVIVVVLSSLVASWVLGRPSSPPAGPTPPPGLVQLSVRLDRTPSQLAVGQGAVWLVDAAGRLERFDLLDHRLVNVGTLPHWTTGRLVAGLGGLWVADLGDSSVLRVNATSGRIERVAVSHAGALTLGATQVWAETAADRLSRLDVVTGKLAGGVRVPGEPDAIAEDFGALWVAAGPTLYRLSPQDGRVLSTAELPSRATAIAATQGAIWVATGDQLLRFDPAGRQQPPARIPGLRALSADHVGTTVYAVDARGSVLAASENGHRAAMRISRRSLVGPADASGAVWVVDGRTLLRLKEFGR
jgi:sugar lactone lactonase YvrE